MDADVERLCRLLCGRAVGVVLGGGGSRGLAHLGLLRQLEARGVPIDVVGGASQGSFMAAAYALSGSAAGCEQRAGLLARSISSAWNFATSLTLPLVSWTSGAHFDDVIREALGSAQIEDLPGPRYFCVSLNATDGAVAVHSTGPLWRYVRASMSVLRLLPPVFDRDTHRLLVDGGYVSNLPVDILHALLPGSVGLTVACDVECKDSNKQWLDIEASDFGPGDSVHLSGFYVLWRVLAGRLGLGKPMRIPWVDDLFLQVSYLRHYSSLRSLLSEAGHDGATEEPLPLSASGSIQWDLAGAGGGGGGGGGGRGGGAAAAQAAAAAAAAARASAASRAAAARAAERADAEAGTWHSDGSARPCLVYVRPKVGAYGLLDYGKMQEIVGKGEAAASASLEAWQRVRVADALQRSSSSSGSSSGRQR